MSVGLEGPPLGSSGRAGWEGGHQAGSVQLPTTDTPALLVCCWHPLAAWGVGTCTHCGGRAGRREFCVATAPTG